MYFSINGLLGDSVWGTRNDWVVLQGKKNESVISMAMFDNPANPGYPAYAHARGYGLFSINNFGQKSYDPNMENRSYKLEKGQSVTFYHRFYVQSGRALTAEEADRIFEDFAKNK
jgi:VCBS repeat-containing protein